MSNTLKVHPSKIIDVKSTTRDLVDGCPAEMAAVEGVRNGLQAHASVVAIGVRKSGRPYIFDNGDGIPFADMSNDIGNFSWSGVGRTHSRAGNKGIGIRVAGLRVADRLKFTSRDANGRTYTNSVMPTPDGMGYGSCNGVNNDQIAVACTDELLTSGTGTVVDFEGVIQEPKELRPEVLRDRVASRMFCVPAGQQVQFRDAVRHPAAVTDELKSAEQCLQDAMLGTPQHVSLWGGAVEVMYYKVAKFDRKNPLPMAGAAGPRPLPAISLLFQKEAIITHAQGSKVWAKVCAALGLEAVAHELCVVVTVTDTVAQASTYRNKVQWWNPPASIGVVHKATVALSAMYDAIVDNLPEWARVQVSTQTIGDSKKMQAAKTKLLDKLRKLNPTAEQLVPDCSKPGTRGGKMPAAEKTENSNVVVLFAHHPPGRKYVGPKGAPKPGPNTGPCADGTDVATMLLNNMDVNVIYGARAVAMAGLDDRPVIVVPGHKFRILINGEFKPLAEARHNLLHGVSDRNMREDINHAFEDAVGSKATYTYGFLVGTTVLLPSTTKIAKAEIFGGERAAITVGGTDVMVAYDGLLRDQLCTSTWSMWLYEIAEEVEKEVGKMIADDAVPRRPDKTLLDVQLAAVGE